MEKSAAIIMQLCIKGIVCGDSVCVSVCMCVLVLEEIRFMSRLYMMFLSGELPVRMGG